MINIEADGGIEVCYAHIVTWANMAEALARADSEAQAKFFDHLAICLDGNRMGPGRWAMQSRAIAEERLWSSARLQRLAGQLEVLAEHLRERAAETP